MSKIALGPWCGEFGFEIMAWQANARQKASGYDEVVIGCVPSSRALYADFATKFWDVPFDPNTSGAKRCNKSEKAVEGNFRRAFHNHKIEPGRVLRPPSKRWFRKYGKDHRGAKYDMLLHARHMIKGTGDKNLRRSAPQEWWDQFFADLRVGWPMRNVDVASVGLSGQSLHVAGTHDMRDVELPVLMDMMRSSKLIVGVTSGPIHLAALCDCPAVVWTDIGHRSGYDRLSNGEKLMEAWNPFNVPVAAIQIAPDSPDPYWLPREETLFEAIEEMMDAQDRTNVGVD